ncbi:DUF317 domain-containing protein [Streptomyces sp. AK08-02]|uniref:DUF317 domain-containing protein n=1 Tax=Streptomyces sp. AK08-02 TaxID=3028654 RepID=UPI0029AABD10|nr:DUF317 domain-containing protein [Streptomyces sp. AK08-02]MDX3751243.1 DUF317 domain-containing protein [Streptomyces sp. AK08-02]
MTLKLNDEAKALKKTITDLAQQATPQMLEPLGVGVDTAAADSSSWSATIPNASSGSNGPSGLPHLPNTADGDINRPKHQHAGLDRERTWDDNTTIANHESLTLRALIDHDAECRDMKWTIAAYESPVSERLWHATATATTPVEIVRTLLNSLASDYVWGAGPATGVSETEIAEATRPLTDAGWKQIVEGRWIRWEAPGEDAAGVQFDAFAAQKPNSPLPTWTVWGGNAVHQPTWALHFSPYTPAAVLQDLIFELAEGQGRRQVPAATTPRLAMLTPQAPAPAPPGQAPAAVSTQTR